MRYQEMVANKLHVYTVKGEQVSSVREAIKVEGGVQVRILVPVIDRDGKLKYPAADQYLNAIEAEAFIKGGVLR